ncbi:hypothetical protein CLOM_g8449 [Closterium sp. NIES-68]|nr:hypothetical protein CLOM_g8449 [Closterium sp. NIES-68]GJP67485.1 hypothetical protein CLOP_g24304 [Closterium sp. NIES-67]
MAAVNASAVATAISAVASSAPCAQRRASRAAVSGSALFNPLRVAAARPVRVSRSGPAVVRAATEETAGTIQGFIDDVKAKWDGVEDKGTLALYAGGSVTAVWLSATVVNAVNSIPVVPNVLELVGTVYTGWFVYRYLLFKSSRRELAELIEDIKARITGST